MSQERNEKRLLRPVQLISKDKRRVHYVKINNPIISTPENEYSIIIDEQVQQPEIKPKAPQNAQQPFIFIEQAASDTYRREAAGVVTEMLQNRKNKLNDLKYKPYANMMKALSHHKRAPSEGVTSSSTGGVFKEQQLNASPNLLLRRSRNYSVSSSNGYHNNDSMSILSS